MHNSWDPKQYEKFTKEREQPFYDLLQLITLHEKMSVVDLGCGTGTLTQVLHQHLKAANTLGIDSSATMLENSHKYEQEGLYFQHLDIKSFSPKQPLDLIFSNACLQWLPDHTNLFKILSEYLSSRGQLAIQIPANFDFPTHTIAQKLAQKPQFAKELKQQLSLTALSIEEYSKILYQLGFKKQRVRMEIYAAVLESTESAIEWVKGSFLTFYRSNLPPDTYQQFIIEYKKQIYDHFGDIKPFFFPFKRILIWAEK